MSGLDHPCIVRLIGVCLGPPLILVSVLFCIRYSICLSRNRLYCVTLQLTSVRETRVRLRKDQRMNFKIIKMPRSACIFCLDEN